jgi:hypothetical protein
MSVSWESINEGDSIPELKKTPGVTQLVKYAAGSGTTFTVILPEHKQTA